MNIFLLWSSTWHFFCKLFTLEFLTCFSNAIFAQNSSANNFPAFLFNAVTGRRTHGNVLWSSLRRVSDVVLRKWLSKKQIMHVVVSQILFLQGLSGFVKFRPVLPSLAAHLILTIFLLSTLVDMKGWYFSTLSICLDLRVVFRCTPNLSLKRDCNQRKDSYASNCLPGIWYIHIGNLKIK